MAGGSASTAAGVGSVAGVGISGSGSDSVTFGVIVIKSVSPILLALTSEGV